MDARERQTIDLLGMLASLKAGWRYLVAVPGLAAVVVLVAFQLFPSNYIATARFTVPDSVYTELRSPAFQREVAARATERGWESGSDRTDSRPTLSPRSDDGSVAISHVARTEAGAALYVGIFAEMALELVRSGAASTAFDTMATLSKQIELDSLGAHNHRTAEALDAMLDRLKQGYGSGPFESAPGDDMAAYMTTYKVLLDTLFSNTTYLETERVKLAQARAELRTEIERTEVAVASAARYSLLPMMLSVTFATLLLTAAFLIGRASLLRAALP